MARRLTHAKELKGARYALWRNAEDLTARQEAKLAWIAKISKRLYRAYLLKEQLRQILHIKDKAAIPMLQKWIAWAVRSRIPSFVDLARRVQTNLAGILQALLNNLSNGLIESTNTKLRVLTRIASASKTPTTLIALAYLDRGGHCPPIPGRT